MHEYTTFVGLDVHKESIAIAVARPGQEVQALDVIPYDEARLVAQLHQLDAVERLRCYYEAGPTGFGIQRALARRGISCMVIAPSLIPRAWGERIKTDRRDAMKLARLARSGDLRAIRVPDESHEHVRDLLRLRYRAVGDLLRHRNQLLKLLLRWEIRPPTGMRHWTQAHRRWLEQLPWPRPAQRCAFGAALSAIDDAVAHRDRLDADLQAVIEQSSWLPLVHALTALHGIAQLTAITLILELAPFSRFADAHKCMASAGLVPRERSSGTMVRRGPITRTGSRFARFALVEAAHHYRRIGRTQQSKRVRAVRASQPPAIAAQAAAAQARLQRLAQRMHAVGKPPQVALVALARELAGAVWKIGVLVERAG